VNTVSIVDPFALGFQAPAIIGINVEPGTTDKVGKALSKSQNLAPGVTLGSYDLLLRYFARIMHLPIHYRGIQKLRGFRSTETLSIANYKLR